MGAAVGRLRRARLTRPPPGGAAISVDCARHAVIARVKEADISGLGIR